jgi:hypothetical protein
MLGIMGRSYASWAAELRACEPADLARAQRRSAGTGADVAKRTAVVSFEGRLLPHMAECTLRGCGSGCCNECSFEWVVALNARCPTQELRVWLRGSPGPLSGAGRDCAVRGYDAEADTVIVTGTIGDPGDIVVEADLCRLPAELQIAGQRLTDADHARLTAPRSRHRRGGDAPKCPAAPAPQARLRSSSGTPAIPAGR